MNKKLMLLTILSLAASTARTESPLMTHAPIERPLKAHKNKRLDKRKARHQKKYAAGLEEKKPRNAVNIQHKKRMYSHGLETPNLKESRIAPLPLLHPKHQSNWKKSRRHQTAPHPRRLPQFAYISPGTES